MYFKLYLLTVVSFEDWCKHYSDWKGCVWSRGGSLALQCQLDEVDGDAKRGCENGISHVWWHHRFLSVAFAWFYPYLVFATVHICYVGGFALMATSIAYGRCVFGEFQLFSWSW